jgi:hypothetical protein
MEVKYNHFTHFEAAFPFSPLFPSGMASLLLGFSNHDARSGGKGRIAPQGEPGTIGFGVIRPGRRRIVGCPRE